MYRRGKHCFIEIGLCSKPDEQLSYLSNWVFDRSSEDCSVIKGFTCIRIGWWRVGTRALNMQIPGPSPRLKGTFWSAYFFKQAPWKIVEHIQVWKPQFWAFILGLPLASCTTLGKSPTSVSFSASWLGHLQNPSQPCHNLILTKREMSPSSPNCKCLLGCCSLPRRRALVHPVSCIQQLFPQFRARKGNKEARRTQ